MKIGVSHCLLGSNCNFNGKDLLSVFVKMLQDSEEIEFIPFCPEDSVFGTPRPNLRIVGGDGFDVLAGNAKVIDELEKDVTETQINGAKKFLNLLNSHQVKTVILMDGSPSCGSNIILKEEGWPMGGFKKGFGVTAALLKLNNINVLSSFDEKAISEFISTMTNSITFSQNLKNLKDSPKFNNLLKAN